MYIRLSAVIYVVDGYSGLKATTLYSYCYYVCVCPSSTLRLTAKSLCRIPTKSSVVSMGQRPRRSQTSQGTKTGKWHETKQQKKTRTVNTPETRRTITVRAPARASPRITSALLLKMTSFNQSPFVGDFISPIKSCIYAHLHTYINIITRVTPKSFYIRFGKKE